MSRSNLRLGCPVRSLQTMLCTIRKNCREICPVIPDGIYGLSTETSVKDLQRKANMPVTGVVDYRTWNEIVSMFYNTVPNVEPSAALSILWQPNQKIYPNEENAHLFPIQSMLRVIGKTFSEMPPISVSGIHDEKSVRCIVWLQEKCALSQTGIIASLEWTYLCALYRLVSGDGTFSL